MQLHETRYESKQFSFAHKPNFQSHRDKMNLEQLKTNNEAPAWMTDSSLKTLQGGYMLPDETPRGMWQRISSWSESTSPPLPDRHPGSAPGHWTA